MFVALTNRTTALKTGTGVEVEDSSDHYFYLVVRYVTLIMIIVVVLGEIKKVWFRR